MITGEEAHRAWKRVGEELARETGSLEDSFPAVVVRRCARKPFRGWRDGPGKGLGGNYFRARVVQERGGNKAKGGKEWRKRK